MGRASQSLFVLIAVGLAIAALASSTVHALDGVCVYGCDPPPPPPDGGGAGYQGGVAGAGYQGGGGGGQTVSRPRIRRPAPEAVRRAQIRRQAYNLNQQGNRLIRQGRHTDAVRAYSQALRLTPYDRVIRQNLDNARSWVRYAEEKAAEARRARQEALAEANKRRARVAGMVGDLARDLKTEAGPTLVTMSDFIPAANAPFGIPGSPKVALATKPEDKPRLVPTASAQLEAAKMIAKQLNGGSLEEIMREQAQCGFDRGPCAGGVPFAALSLEGRLAQQRGMEALEPAVARAVLQTEKGRQLAAQENEIRAQLAESREKAKAISRQIETSSPSDKPKREAEVVKERGRADRLNQQLHGVQAEIVSFSISLEEAPAQQRGTTPRPAGTDAGGKTAPQGGAAPPEGKAGN